MPLLALVLLWACNTPPFPEPNGVAVEVFPTPFVDQLNVTLTFFDSTEAEILLLGADADEETLFEGMLVPDTDTSNLAISPRRQFSFDLRELPSGDYRLLVRTETPATVQVLDILKF